MNKTELMNEIAVKAGLSKKDAEKAIVALLNGKSLILTETAQAACDVLEAAGATWYSARSASGDEVCWLSQPNISAARSIAAAFAE